MRVLLVVSDPKQGILNYQTQLALKLKSIGIDIEVITWTLKGQKSIYNIELSSMIKLNNIPMHIYTELKYSGFKSMNGNVVELAKLLANNKFDIVHVHGPLSAMIFRRALKFNSYSKIINAISRSFGSGVKAKFKSLLSGCISHICSDKILVLSEFEKIKTYWYLKKVTTAYNPIDVDHINKYSSLNPSSINIRRDLSIEENNKIICCFSNFSENKNQEKIIHSLHYMSKNVTLVLAGEGETKDRIRQVVRDLKLEERVILLSRIPENLVKEYLCGSDLAISISNTETFGYSIAEPILLRVPLLTTPAGIAFELEKLKMLRTISHDISPIQLAHEINEAIDDRFNILMQQEQARNYLIDKCSVGNYVNNLIDIYKV